MIFGSSTEGRERGLRRRLEICDCNTTGWAFSVCLCNNGLEKMWSYSYTVVIVLLHGSWGI